MEILKIPVCLEGFSFRKGTQDWAITFALAPEQLHYGKPLMDLMNQSFVLVSVHVKSEAEGTEVLGKKSFDDFSINMDELNGK